MADQSEDKIQEICKPKEDITYEKLNSEYKINGRTQVLDRMINQISLKMITSSRSESYSIRNNLNRIVNDLMLNELELSLWALYLAKFPFKKLKKANEKLIIFSAFKAKSELVDDIQPYFSFLTRRVPEFKNKYLKWTLANKETLEYTPNEINDKFNELTNIDEDFPNNFNIDYESKEPLPPSSIATPPNWWNYFSNNEPLEYLMKEDLENITSLKRHKVGQDIKANKFEEKNNCGQVFIHEAIEQRKK